MRILTRRRFPPKCPRERRQAKTRGAARERANGRRRGGRERAIWRRGWRRAEPVRSGACADCGANSAERTTTGSRLASSTSNLALFKNEDGAALKSDKSLIGRSRDRSYFGATAAESRFYSGARRFATFRRALARNTPVPGINKIKTRGGRGVREFVARARRPVRGYVTRFERVLAPRILLRGFRGDLAFAKHR